jgi:multiple sugar transport system permease protein
METTLHQKSIRKDNPVLAAVLRVIIYIVLIALAVFTLIPFVWMISSSLKLDREVFAYPMTWIPETFHWENYSLIWTRVPLVTYFKNTAFIAVVVTLLQTLTSSFAAYAFAKLTFKGRDTLFLAYIGTIAVPWQAYMLPQFIMMRSMGLYDTLWAMVVLQAFSAFGVFLMRQFYRGIPTELCEAARLDGLSEYGIWARIMLPLSKAAIATLVIFTFVNTWNDFMGPMIYLTRDENKTIQVGLRRFIQQYSSDYHLIMAASLVSLLPVSIVFLTLQKYFIEGIATSGLKG